MSDSEEEKVERVKKPRTPAQQEAVKRMLEGRKKSIELKKKEKENEKANKKLLKKQIKEKVIEETNMLNNLSPVEINELRKKAVETPNNISMDIVEEPVVPEPAIAEQKPSNFVPSRRKQTKPKKRVIVNNYYEEEGSSSSEEEIVNNYYTKKKRKKVAKKVARRPCSPPPPPLESSSSEEEHSIDIAEEPLEIYSNLTNDPFNPYGDIIFR
jgi:hypothetical protein